MLTTESYNAILFALSSRTKYAEECLMKFRRMIEEGVVPDNHTVVAVLRATSKIGDVKTASDLVGYMKWFSIPLNEHVYNGLIKTYGGACLKRDVHESHILQYLDDIWVLVD